MNKPDGGPAFPQMLSRREWSTDEGVFITHIDTTGGLSLRDWFAGQALAGITADSHNDNRPEQNAELAYRLAVAMLAERDKE